MGVSSEVCLVKTIEGNEQRGVYHRMLTYEEDELESSGNETQPHLVAVV